MAIHSVVIPLSAIAPRRPTLSGFLTVIGHALFVGIPAAAFARTPGVAAHPASSRRAISSSGAGAC
jgi:hypothetical protein